MKRKFKSPKLLMLGLFVLFIVVSLVLTVPFSFNDHKYIITVTDKERINKDDESKYLIFGDSDAEEDLIFENTDTLLRGKFNSSNIYSKLKVGNTYEITVVGYRIPLISCYENIIKVNEVN